MVDNEGCILSLHAGLIFQLYGTKTVPEKQVRKILLALYTQVGRRGISAAVLKSSNDIAVGHLDIMTTVATGR